MRYAGWNFEKTLLITERANLDRRRELVDVRLAVETERAGNLANDVRVIIKKDWNLLDREIPCQVYGIAQHGPTTTFRVAFHLDLPAGQSQRVGVYYDNPAAAAVACPTSLEVCGAGLAHNIRTPWYELDTDPVSGQISAFVGKLNEEGISVPRLLQSPGAVQEGNAVVLAIGSGSDCRPVAVTAAAWKHPQIVQTTHGPIFFQQTRRASLAPPADLIHAAGMASVQWPQLEITYKFFAEQPQFLVHSRLVFPEALGVFAVCNDLLTLSRAQFSHYTFRPVSPALPLTELEEMGHIVIDPIHGADLPHGIAFSDLLPIDLAWHAFINIHQYQQHAFTGIQLASSVHTPGQDSRRYRPGTYLVRQSDTVQWYRAPIHVQARRNPNIIQVAAGTVFEDLTALHFSDWDAAWGQRIDELGKRLNNPLQVTIHPHYLRPVPPEPFETLPAGRRADAYLRAGVR